MGTVSEPRSDDAGVGGSGGRVGRGGPGGDRSALGRRLLVGVAAVEAVAAAGAAVVAVVSGTQGGSLPLAIGVAVVAVGVAYLLVEVARAFAQGRRWPRGIFVTVQLLVLLVALSVGAPSLTAPAEAPRIAAVTALALLVAAAGLVGVGLTGGRDRANGPPGQS